MDIFNVIISAFSEGGYGLVIVVGLIYLARLIMRKLGEMNTKIDVLKDEVASLKVSQERYVTAIKLCDNPDCAVKQKLGL